ncbi:Ribonuclease H2 subunit A [Linum perenne]
METEATAAALPKWASKPCIMGIDEAGRGPVLGPMVYGCLYCARSYQKTLSTLNFADSKTLKEEKREELYESLKADRSIGWAVDVIDPRELSAKMLKKQKINLNEISHDSASGLVKRVLNMGVRLTEVYVDTVGDPEKYRVKLSERFPSIKFVVAKKADSLYPVVSGASIVAKVTRDRSLREWVLDETHEDIGRNFGSGYPAVVRFSWATCNSYFKDGAEVLWEADSLDENDNGRSNGKRQSKLSSLGVTTSKKKKEEVESSGRGRCQFLETRKLDQIADF